MGAAILCPLEAQCCHSMACMYLCGQGGVVLDGPFGSFRWSLCHSWTQSASVTWELSFKRVTQEAWIRIKKPQDTCVTGDSSCSLIDLSLFGWPLRPHLSLTLSLYLGGHVVTGPGD